MDNGDSSSSLQISDMAMWPGSSNTLLLLSIIINVFLRKLNIIGGNGVKTQLSFLRIGEGGKQLPSREET